MAQYFEDWSGSTIGQPPTGWTQRWWAASSAIWTIIDLGSGQKALRYGDGVNTTARRGLSYDALDDDEDRDDFEIVFKWRCAGLTSQGPQLKCWGRASGSQTSSTHNAYLGGVDYAVASATPLRLQKYVNGTSSTIGTSAAFGLSTDTWYITRFRVNGTTMQMRTWLASDPEPETWQRTATDTSHSAAGWVGLFGFNGALLHDVEWVGFGTGGAAAPMSGGADTTAPALTSPSASATGSTTASGTVSTNEGNGTLYWLASENSSESVVAVKAGSSQAVTETGAQSVTVSSLVPSTSYYLHFVHRDGAGNDSTVATSAQFTTSAEDTTPPTLTGPTAIATGETTASGAVSTNEATGTLFWIASENPSESAAVVKTGDAQAVSAVGTQTVTVSGLTASTAYYVHFLHRDAAGNDSEVVSSAEFITDDEAVAIAVAHDLDAGNINPALTVITNATASEPEVSVKPRATVGATGSGHVHWFFALTGANGKRPTITVDNSARRLNTTMVSSWRPVYSYDLETWYQATAFTALTSPTRVQFQFPDAFTADTVYIADHPVFQQAGFDALAAELAADSTGLVHLSASAGAGGVIGTTPSEADDIGRAAGGNSIYGFRLEDESAVTTDGEPRRELVVTCGMHAGEVIDGWFLRALVDYFLNNVSATGIAFRKNWRVLTYFAITPNGRKGGNWRGNFRDTEDPNRDWVGAGAFSLYETTTVRNAILADTTRRDVLLDFHSDAASSVVPRIYSRSDLHAGIYTAFKVAFDARDGSSLTMDPSTATGTIGEWFAANGAKLVITSEPGTRTSTSIARYEQIATSYVDSVVDLDAAGWFAISADLSASAGLAAGGTATIAASLALSAVGLVVSGGDAPIRAAVPLSAIGYALAGGNAVLEGSAAGDLQAIGGAQAGGSANLVANVRISAEGLMQAAGAAGLTVAVLQAAAGGAQAGGDVVLSLEVQLAASGGMQAGGVAALDAGEPGSISAIGGAQAGGSATITATVLLTAAGILQAFAAGYLVAQVDLSAVGGAAPGGAAVLSDAAALVLIESRRWVVEAAGRRWVVTA
ncbi:M14-type cytosolic carboxypeptidase [Thauera sp.]|uniref:M14-type cytosolic carboxypeptidase n=1 Tax=Thauera sp. TaxID=1905334 RepID=UPI00257D2E4B|nr:M14-type cytosolic carboxypeptidase [Thauera sp.]